MTPDTRARLETLAREVANIALDCDHSPRVFCATCLDAAVALLAASPQPSPCAECERLRHDYVCAAQADTALALDIAEKLKADLAAAQAAQAQAMRERDALEAALRQNAFERGCHVCGRKADDIQLFGHSEECTLGDVKP
jgi:hypothetical protein